MSKYKLVPELYCSNIEKTKNFYLEILGFEIKYQRIQEHFIYFTLDGVDIMVESIHAVGRHWISGSLEQPFGRGINFQWEIADIQSHYKRVKAFSPQSIFMDLEVKKYIRASDEVEQSQYIVQDPDGYLFRFCSKLEVILPT